MELLTIRNVKFERCTKGGMIDSYEGKMVIKFVNFGEVKHIFSSGKVVCTLGYLINVQQTLLFFEKNFQIQNFQIFILACFAFYS